MASLPQPRTERVIMEAAVGKEDFNPYDYEGSPAVNVYHGYLATLIGWLAFTTISYVAILVGPPKNMKGDIWRWRNTFVSWIHAVILGTGALYCLIFKQDVFSRDMILYCDSFIYSLVAISLGYFLYDVQDHAVSGKLFSNYEVILHHFGVIWSFGYNIHYKVNLPYTIVALMVEVNTIFLHARKLMQLDQWPFSHWLYKMVVGLNLITFIRFRLWGIILVGIGVYDEWHRLTLTYQVFIVLSMFIMYVINPILFWRLFKNDVLRNCKTSQLKEHQHSNGIKGNDIHHNDMLDKQP